MKIRKMQESDIEEVHGICANEPNFQVSPNVYGVWSKEDFKKWVASEDNILYAVIFLIFMVMVVLYGVWVLRKEYFKKRGIKLKRK